MHKKQNRNGLHERQEKRMNSKIGVIFKFEEGYIVNNEKLEENRTVSLIRKLVTLIHVKQKKKCLE